MSLFHQHLLEGTRAPGGLQQCTSTVPADLQLVLQLLGMQLLGLDRRALLCLLCLVGAGFLSVTTSSC